MHKIKKQVQKRYGDIATANQCGCQASGCCGSAIPANSISTNIGYTAEQLASIPKEADLGLGCGNPTAFASLQEGETVVDLGSGAGIDCFLAANKVGRTGHVIGIDMTPEMITKAQANATKGNFSNVEFRLGEIESLPVESNSVDVIISNCVINLSPEKERVFKEAYRVLKTGGRLIVSDLVLLTPLPPAIKKSVEAYVGCIAGASLKDDYIQFIREAGFKNVVITSETAYPIDIGTNTEVAAIIKKIKATEAELKTAQHSVVSIKVIATK